MNNDEEMVKLIKEKVANGEPVRQELIFWAEDFEISKKRHEELTAKREAIIARIRKEVIDESNETFDALIHDIQGVYESTKRLIPDDALDATNAEFFFEEKFNSIIRKLEEAKKNYADPNFIPKENELKENTPEHEASEEEKLNYRLYKGAYTSSDTKLRHIQDFEQCGLLMHKSNGGGFINGEHASAFTSLHMSLLGIKKDEIEASKPIRFLDVDTQAFEEWNKNYKDSERGDELEMKGFESFAIKCLNVAKVGSVIDTKCRAIATSDSMPCTRFEDWIRDGYAIARLKGFSFDRDKKLFLPRIITASQSQAEQTKRLSLEDELGEKVHFI